MDLTNIKIGVSVHQNALEDITSDNLIDIAKQKAEAFIRGFACAQDNEDETYDCLSAIGDILPAQNDESGFICTLTRPLELNEISSERRAHFAMLNIPTPTTRTIGYFSAHLNINGQISEVCHYNTEDRDGFDTLEVNLKEEIVSAKHVKESFVKWVATNAPHLKPALKSYIEIFDDPDSAVSQECINAYLGNNENKNGTRPARQKPFRHS